VSLYEGIARLPDAIYAETSQPRRPHRKLIIRLVPWDAFVFAQLNLTGSEMFIRHLREQAARIGYRLSADNLEKRKKTTVEVFGVDGLQFLGRDDGREEGELVLMDSEEDIFRFLKMEYVHPHARNWY
jgi:DNA polymerase/3'-5' exonuclease PolX